MRVASGAPFWLLRCGLYDETETALPGDADVVIVGAGITGALLADRFVRERRSVVIIERDAPTEGSTAVSTALLQYELDVELVELAEMIGEDRAVRAYRRCVDGIGQLQALAHGLDDDGDFARATSVYLASRRSHARRLRDEADMRAHHGLPVEWLSRSDVHDRFGMKAHAALHTQHAANLDPVRLARSLLSRAIAGGATLCTRTPLLEWSPSDARVRVQTARGEINAGALIFATGYEMPGELPGDIVSLHSSYALVTQPIEQLGPLRDNTMFWETARPYAYMRVTPDGRVLVGGVDVPFKNVNARDALLASRTRMLERRLHSMLGRAHPTAFAWAGTFGETDDGLPRIGRMPGFRHAYAALGYGGNGIVFSQVAADILAGLCLGDEDPDTQLFGFDRRRI